MDWRERDTRQRPQSSEVDLASLCQTALRARRWIIALALAAAAFAGTVLCLQTPLYSAEAQIALGPHATGLIGWRAAAAFLQHPNGCAEAQGQLIASRDVARRAIKDLGLEGSAEFDPPAEKLGPAAEALSFLGLLRLGGRVGTHEDRLLDAFGRRLHVAGPGEDGILTITFQSQDRELAANAANRLAELYVGMTREAAASLLCQGRARIVARAAPPAVPLFPRRALIILSSVTMIVMGLGAGAAAAWPRLPSSAPPERPVEQPRSLGQPRQLVRFREALGHWPRAFDAQPLTPLPGTEAIEKDGAVEELAARIRALPAANERAVRILATRAEAGLDETRLLRDLARCLAQHGRAIAIGLEEEGYIEPPAKKEAGLQAPAAGASPSLGELLAGCASFAEVIRRDRASRLHVLPMGRSHEVDLSALGPVFDALAETYDFVMLIAPPGCNDEAIRTLACAADVRVLAAKAGASSDRALILHQLLGSGALMLIEGPANGRRGRGRQAA